MALIVFELVCGGIAIATKDVDLMKCACGEHLGDKCLDIAGLALRMHIVDMKDRNAHRVQACLRNVGH